MTAAKTFSLGALAILLLMVLSLITTQADIPTVPAVNPADHAWIRHGTDAARAIEAVNRAPHCRWECPDGRSRFVCRAGGNRWAVVVMEGVELVTAFLTDRGYAKAVTEPCSNPWRYSH